MNNGNARYYNTGKVLIGVAYQPPLQQLTREGEEIQSILLGSRPARYWNANTVTKQIMWFLGGLWLVLMLVGVLR